MSRRTTLAISPAYGTWIYVTAAGAAGLIISKDADIPATLAGHRRLPTHDSHFDTAISLAFHF